MARQMDHIHEPEYNARRYEKLAKLGMRTYENGDIVQIIHEESSRMMEGIAYLCKAPDSKYKSLPAKSVEVVKKLEHNLSGMKIKAKIKPLRGIVSDFKWKVEYAYKGKNICEFYADHEYFMLCIYFNYFQNINEFAKIMYEENYDLFQWFEKQFPERLCNCPNNRRGYFGGEPRRICGLSNRAEIVNPDGRDVDRAFYVLRKYRKQ